MKRAPGEVPELFGVACPAWPCGAGAWPVLADASDEEAALAAGGPTCRRPATTVTSPIALPASCRVTVIASSALAPWATPFHSMEARWHEALGWQEREIWNPARVTYPAASPWGPRSRAVQAESIVTETGSTTAESNLKTISKAFIALPGPNTAITSVFDCAETPISPLPT